MLKTLIIVTPGFPKDETDSTCLPDRQIFVKVLKETYPDLNVIVLTFEYPLQAASYQWHGVNVIALGGQNKGGFHRRLNWLRALQVLKNIRQQNNVIGLLSFWLDECAFISNKFVKKHDLKHHIWLLGQDARPGNRYVQRIKPRNGDLIALSDHLANEYRKNYGVMPAHVIPGAIDPSVFKTILYNRDVDILGVGSLIPLKQYHLFIDTVNFLKRYKPAIKAVICGKGPEAARLQQMVDTYGLGDNITFKGELSHAEVLEHMQRSKILLHPSNYEGFSTVLLESLYAGAHVVSFFKPMEEGFPHHHIVANNEEMNRQVLLLLNDALDHTPILINEMTEMATSIMALYDDSVISLPLSSRSFALSH